MDGKSLSEYSQKLQKVATSRKSSSKTWNYDLFNSPTCKNNNSSHTRGKISNKNKSLTLVLPYVDDETLQIKFSREEHSSKSYLEKSDSYESLKKCNDHAEKPLNDVTIQLDKPSDELFPKKKISFIKSRKF